MDPALKDWLDTIAKILGGLGFIVAAISYRSQQRIKRAEWLKSLYEKFFENSTYKEVRVWLDYGYLHDRLTIGDPGIIRANEEMFTDFLNFFEFIAVLNARAHLSLDQVYDVFDYYLKKIKSDPDCQNWIERYGFEKLRGLLQKM
jgi:hypothetical protein